MMKISPELAQFIWNERDHAKRNAEFAEKSNHNYEIGYWRGIERAYSSVIQWIEITERRRWQEIFHVVRGGN